MSVGVLALQGDFARHRGALARCGVVSTEVRTPAELEAVDALILPGGESTTLLRLMEAGGLDVAIRQFHAAGKPVFGTCAGLILIAKSVESPRQLSLGLIDVRVERNAYGRQRESFEAVVDTALPGASGPLRMIFIRAPRIREVGPGVEVLARYGEEPVLARQGSVLVATFHPELTDDPRVHRYFCGTVRGVPPRLS